MNEEDVILKKIENEIPKYFEKYNERPQYVKLPLWAFLKLKDYAKEMMVRFDYKELEPDEDFTVFGLRVCETPTIESIEEIEVF